MSNHDHKASKAVSRNLIWAIAINTVIAVAEVVFGVVAGSIALISDALHNFADIGSMALSLWGEMIAERPNTSNKTYGYKRAEVIIAFVNGSLLLGVSGMILVESVVRIFKPEPVAGFTMLVVAVVSLIGNSLATHILKKDAKKNLNLKSAWLHAMQDGGFGFFGGFNGSGQTG